MIIYANERKSGPIFGHFLTDEEGETWTWLAESL